MDIIQSNNLWFGTRDRDSLGFYKRQLSALVQVYCCLLQGKKSIASEMLELAKKPKLSGFAGFQAPAYLVLAEAFYIYSYHCFYQGFYQDIEFCLNRAREAAHNIQDARFCAKATSRCKAMQHHWWKSPTKLPSNKAKPPVNKLSFNIDNISEIVDRLCKNPASPEFAALHQVGEEYSLRTVGPNKLPLPNWLRQADTLEAIAQIYQKSVVELQRFNSEQNWAIDTPLPSGTWVNVPDPGFVNLLTGRLSAEILVDRDLSDGEQVRLIQALVPLASANPTVLDTVLSRLLLAARPNDASVLDALDATVKRYLS